MAQQPGSAPPRRPASRARSRRSADEEWQADLDALRDGLAQKHKDAFARVKKEDFERAAAELREKIPGMKDYEVVTGFMKLAAMIGDGHTMMVTEVGNPPARTSYPLGLLWLSDGVFIGAATEMHKGLLGAAQVGGEKKEPRPLERPGFRRCVSRSRSRWRRT